MNSVLHSSVISGLFLMMIVLVAPVLYVLPATAQSGAESGSVSVTPDPVYICGSTQISVVVVPPASYPLAIDVTKPNYDTDTIGYPITDDTGQYKCNYEPHFPGTYRVRVWIQGDQSGNPAVLIAQAYFDVIDAQKGIRVENKGTLGLYSGCDYEIRDESDALVSSFHLNQGDYIRLMNPIFFGGGIFSITQVTTLPSWDFVNIYAEPGDEGSEAWAVGTTAYVQLSGSGSATVTFSYCNYGINYIWATYTGTTLEEGYQTNIWRADPYYNETYFETDGFANVFDDYIKVGGLFHVTVTTKYGYTTDMSIEDFGTTTSSISSTPTGLEATINLEPYGAVLITFFSAEVLMAATPLNQPPVVDLTYNIPKFTIVPVQAAWESDKNGDGTIDLVAGKATAFLVNVSASSGVILDLKIDGASVGQPVAVAANGIVSFWPIYLTTGTHEISVTYVTSILQQIDPVQVSVRDTNDLSLYYGYLYKTTYGAPTLEKYRALATASDSFMGAVYPVKAVAASTLYTQLKGQSSMLKDCMAVAAAALKNNRAVGVAVASSGYFPSYGYPNGVGVSYGPNFKGVIVTEGYWTVAAHEVGHTYNLYWGVPENYQQYPPYGQSASGVAATDGKWRSGQDFMGCAPKETLEYTWVNSVGTYNNLFAKFTLPTVDPETVIVSGIFHSDGTFERPLAWSRLEQGTVSDVVPGDYELVFLDANSIPIEGSDVNFDASFHSSISMGVAVGKNTPSAEGIGLTDEDEAGFIFAVPLPRETASIEVWDNTGTTPERVGTVLASEIVDANAPTAYFTDADYNPLDSFECVFTPDKGTYKMSATNPGTFCYNLQLTNMDPTKAFSVVVKISSDFTLRPPYPGASAVQVNGQPIAYEFIPGTGGMLGTLTVSNIMVEEGRPKTLSVKLKYGPTQTFDSSSQTSFHAGYLFNAWVNSDQAPPATITAVGKKVTAIGGFLTDVNGFPKDGLTVIANGDPLLTDTTGEDGFYFIMLPAAGTYNVKVYNSVPTQLAAASLKVLKDQFVSRDFNTLNPADPAIKGFVTDAFGDGISGASVQLLNKQGRIFATTTTNNRGGYVFRFYQPGEYTVMIAVPSGYIAAVRSVTLRVKLFETAKVNFNLAVKP